MTSVYLQAITDARQRLETGKPALAAAMLAAKPYHSWSELSRASGLSRSGCRFLVMNLFEERRPDATEPHSP